MESSDGRAWTFLTNHARVLIAIARDPRIRIRDLSDGIGITERAAQLIVNDLVEADYLTRRRVGRRNTYTVDSGRPFRYPTEADQRVEALLSLFTRHDESRPADPHTPQAPRPAHHQAASDER